MLVVQIGGLALSRSFTSRPARPGERDGVDYNFISRSRFEAMARGGEFLEWADVFDNYYGTCRADTERCLANGQDIVLVIDVQGARQVRNSGMESIGIIVQPPSAEILEQRLRGRSKDSEAALPKRLAVACRGVGEYASYEYVVVNDELDAAVERLRGIVLAERARVKAMRGAAEDIIGTFVRLYNGRGRPSGGP
jgi:guanylate kinase